jgi:hypothetical protein
MVWSLVELENKPVHDEFSLRGCLGPVCLVARNY